MTDASEVEEDKLLEGMQQQSVLGLMIGQDIKCQNTLNQRDKRQEIIVILIFWHGQETFKLLLASGPMYFVLPAGNV